MTWDPATKALANKCQVWFLENYVNNQHGSLQILCTNPKGELYGFKLTAEDDAEMFRETRAFLKKERALRYVAVGSVHFQNQEKEWDMLVIYWQQPGIRSVQKAFRLHYEGEQGIALDPNYYEQDPLPESWI